MGHYASIENKRAPLASDFGREFMARRFPAEVVKMVEEEFGLLTRGPNKGKLRGYILWDKCTRGGWHRTGPGYEPGECSQGYVMRPGTHNVRLAMNPDAIQQVLTEEAATWRPLPITDEHLVEVARNKGIDPEAIVEEARQRHLNNLREGLKGIVEASKSRSRW